MKKFILFLLIFIAGFINANSQWVKVCDLYSGGAEGFADNGSYLYAVLSGDGVYRSTNNGIDWVLIYSGFGSKNLNSIVSKDNFVFVGSDTGLFRSQDYGYNWSYIKNIVTFSATILSSNNLNYIFPGSGNQMYKSSNWGENWTMSTNGIPNYSSVYSMSSFGNIVYAGIFTTLPNSMGVYKSIDLGNNWNLISSNFEIYSKSLYTWDNLILSGGGEEVSISTNYGNNWRHIPGMTNNSYLFGFTSVGTKDIFISSWSRGFYVSNDTGQTWNLRNEGLGNLNSTALHRFGNYLYISLNPLFGNGGIYRRPVSEVIGINNISTEIPTTSVLYQNYPNPFNASTIIKYQIKNNNFVRLKIFDLLGKEIETPVNEKQSAGIYEFNFDGSNLSSGIYFYSLYVDGNIVDTKKLILLK